ncbi:MAG: metallophosphoesterase family protein [Gemmatimonadetes bacterium]|uniref:Metallophosphoesterase family protein n=1 Tax=Candidatus Kutchimonas denitrificans TaxID=3056748 RepID=A0AAE4ZAB1_9BACT|nr:metallophosphoesterase family protein [Gemmatimonadota bacterium]NIR73690.1 metallophosphoesterase family protein [Candidatus Kutchimonas denitrificans]NIS00740.1 metallophosphoesterase family protein [Gemmatimonadota bacterium]NIT66327.1 metallophosphoesterase family protein [Gemmatimonadota bacterium]NIU51545.1 metallophosphoesterase [Gemmatimonadota bacterium]
MSGGEPTHERIAVFGGVYSNHLALAAAIADARARDVDAIFCLGDMGAFGPHPDKVFPLLIENDVSTLRGNYDDSIARGLDDCQCGYTDPRDNHFAGLSYRYTYEKTSPRWRDWMGALPERRRIRLGDRRALLCHGSPRRMNEFLWESTTPDAFIEKLCREFDADVILCTHTGIHWSRPLRGGRLCVNVGAIGRPANDGRTDVWYALLQADDPLPRVEFVPVAYDHEALATEMAEESLPREFIDTILSGWWTTCTEILPMKERRRGMF